VLILSGVPEEAITENDLLGTKTRTLALPLAHESDLKFVAGLLQPTPPSMAPQSVLQVLLAHAAEVDRHARESVASAEMHDLLRQAIASNTVGVDRQLLTRAFDAVVERVALQSIGADASAHLAARVGQLDVRVLADRHPVPAIAPATMAQQVAGSEIRFERLIGPIGIQLVGEMFRRATWESISNRGLGRAEALST
jgi:hypothetical protein